MEEEKQEKQEFEANESKGKSSSFPFIFVFLLIFVSLGFLVVGRSGVLKNFTGSSTKTGVIETIGEENGNGKVQESVKEDEKDVKIVEVEGGMYYFDPNEIRVKKGEKVRIVFKSVDGMHDFVIDDLGVRTKIIKAGKTAEVEFVADRTGEYEYYCSVSNHRAMGMKGTLFVSE
jgi:cytochrome c oxidase subunit 2